MQLSALSGIKLPLVQRGRTVAYASRAWPMKSDKGKTVKKENLPSKTCVACGRPFTWYCSEKCRRSKALIPQALSSASMAAAVEAPPVHSTDQAGTAAAASVTLSCQDLGNIVHLEHLNLEVPDTLLAERFYGQAMGLTADPGSTAAQRGGVGVTWYNIGKQQFHISPGPKPQRTPLPVKLVLPDHKGMLKRLRLAEEKLEGTQYKYEQKGDDTLLVTDPWGQQFEVLSPAEQYPYERGIKDITLPCAPGTAAAIGKFFEKLYMARVTVGKEGDAVCASVVHGPSSTITYVESQDVQDPEAALQCFEGWHVAFYLANFSTVYNTVKDAGLNLLDHKYNDKSPTLEDALKHSQFRMQDITAVEDSPEGSQTVYKKGDVLYRFGHEVRSLYHPRYLRPLYTRGLNIYDDHGPDLLD